MSARQPPEVRRITIGYGKTIYGEIILDAHDQPRFSGHTDALREIWRSVTHQPLYYDLTPPQILGRMTQTMRGPTWAAPVQETPDHGE